MEPIHTTARGRCGRRAATGPVPRARCAPLLVVLITVVLTACTGTTDDARETSDGRASPAAAVATSAPPRIKVASWVGEDLPPAAGGMTRSGDLGIYFAEVDHQYTLVAIDITTGAERWRQRVHQLGRVRGTVHSPTVDWDRGLVFAGRFEPDEDPPLLGMFAYDLDGTERWRAGGVGTARAIYLCGDELVCASQPGGTVRAFLRDSGASPLRDQGGVGRVLGRFDEWLITANAERRLVELGHIDADGIYERQWRRSFAKLFEDEQVGATYTPDGGWYSDHDEDTGVAGVAFGTFADVADAEGLRAEAEAGLAVSLVSDDGEVNASWTHVDLCMSSESWREDMVVLCEDLEVVDDARVIDGEPAPYFRATRVSGYRTSDGQRLWTTALGGPVETIVPTSDGSRFLASPTGADPVVLDLDDGTTAAPAETPELIVACEAEYEDGVEMAQLDTPDGDREGYRRATDLSQLCDASGEIVDPNEFLATGAPVPQWFGYRPDLDDGEEAQGADRWAVWITPDGTLKGAGPASEASG